MVATLILEEIQELNNALSEPKNAWKYNKKPFVEIVLLQSKYDKYDFKHVER